MHDAEDRKLIAKLLEASELPTALEASLLHETAVRCGLPERVTGPLKAYASQSARHEGAVAMAKAQKAAMKETWERVQVEAGRPDDLVDMAQGRAGTAPGKEELVKPGVADKLAGFRAHIGKVVAVSLSDGSQEVGELTTVTTRGVWIEQDGVEVRLKVSEVLDVSPVEEVDADGE